MVPGQGQDDGTADLTTAIDIFEQVRRGYSFEEFLNHDDLRSDMRNTIEARGLSCSVENVLWPLFAERRHEAGLPESKKEYPHPSLDDSLRREIDSLAVRFREEHGDKTIERLLVDTVTRAELTTALLAIGVPQHLLPTARRAAQNVTKTKERLAAAKLYAAQGGGRPKATVLPLQPPNPQIAIVEKALAALAATQPAAAEAARRVLRELKARDGQPVFRANVLALYGGKCAISGCGTLAALQAAHIEPFKGPDSHRITNGMPLRADLHNLFDADLLGIEPKTGRVHVHPDIRKNRDYAELDGMSISLPLHAQATPETKAMQDRWHRFQQRCEKPLGG